jgi:hypothetical protein
MDAYRQGGRAAERCEVPRRRGLYYVALFDLVDAKRHAVIGAAADAVLEGVKQSLTSSDIDRTKLKWLEAREDART